MLKSVQGVINLKRFQTFLWSIIISDIRPTLTYVFIAKLIHITTIN